MSYADNDFPSNDRTPYNAFYFPDLYQTITGDFLDLPAAGQERTDVLLERQGELTQLTFSLPDLSGKFIRSATLQYGDKFMTEAEKNKLQQFTGGGIVYDANEGLGTGIQHPYKSLWATSAGVTNNYLWKQGFNRLDVSVGSNSTVSFLTDAADNGRSGWWGGDKTLLAPTGAFKDITG